MTARRCAVSIDLDGIGCYYRIHGLGAAPAELAHVVLERALPRAANLFAARGLHVTWFVVGRDADADAALPDRAARAANAARLAVVAQHGDELANHSYSHPYEDRIIPNKAGIFVLYRPSLVFLPEPTLQSLLT
jgi:hypothetical protein